MKLFSWNVNGLRAVGRKGFSAWFAEWRPDILSIQETKAKPEQLDESLRHPQGYHSFWHSAEKAGYSGVGIICKREPLSVFWGLGRPEFDSEGRFLVAEFTDFILANGYFPHVRHNLDRLDYKLAFCDAVLDWGERIRSVGKPVVLCGDINIAHDEYDLANPRANRKNPGFLPEERAWMSRFLATGFRDVFRERTGPEAGHYTWWSYRKGVRERNVGWRIDYHCVQDDLADRVLDIGHQSSVYGSDHCPIYLTLKD